MTSTQVPQDTPRVALSVAGVTDPQRDANVGYWDSGITTESAAIDTLLQRALDMAPSEATAILDVACGDGTSSAAIAARFPGAQIVAIDAHEASLAAASTRAPGVETRIMSPVELGFADASFDLVVCIEAMLDGPGREAFFAEAHRVLKPSGRLVLADAVMDAGAQGSAASPASLGDYEALLGAAGFTDVNVTDVADQTWNRAFLRAVAAVHERFLVREIDRAEMNRLLDPAYAVVGAISHYVLAAATRT